MQSDILKTTLLRTFKPSIVEQIKPLEIKACNYLDSIPLEADELKIIVQVSEEKNGLFAYLFAINNDYQPVRQIDIDGKKSFKLTELLSNLLEMI